jgi:hypothetical protein
VELDGPSQLFGLQLCACMNDKMCALLVTVAIVLACFTAQNIHHHTGIS